jgi:hypothetical protein
VAPAFDFGGCITTFDLGPTSPDRVTLLTKYTKFDSCHAPSVRAAERNDTLAAPSSRARRALFACLLPADEASVAARACGRCPQLGGAVSVGPYADYIAEHTIFLDNQQTETPARSLTGGGAVALADSQPAPAPYATFVAKYSIFKRNTATARRPGMRASPVRAPVG